MKRRRVPRQVARLVLALLLAPDAHATRDERLVLVVGRSSPVAQISSLQLHRLYLGLPVEAEGVRLRALRNLSDELMRQVFYQSIVSMSESVYDRRMLALTLQRGLSPPPVLDSTEQVFDALARDPSAVSFAWASDAQRDSRVRVLRVLWSRGATS